MRLSTLLHSTLLAATSLVAASGALAQTAAAHVAMGDEAYGRLDARGALAHYEAALAAEPRNYTALWKASRSAMDLGEFARDAAWRSALFTGAEQRARRAVEVNPSDAEGLFALARALGRRALTLGARDRVRYARDVRGYALECLRINPGHAGCMHVLGVWNAEVMRLSGLTRMIAKNFLGGRVFGSASWAEAQRYMEGAVAAEPARIVHRLDLGRVYADRGMRAKARAEFEAVIRAPARDFNDRFYQAEADAALRKL